MWYSFRLHWTGEIFAVQWECAAKQNFLVCPQNPNLPPSYSNDSSLLMLFRCVSCYLRLFPFKKTNSAGSITATASNTLLLVLLVAPTDEAADVVNGSLRLMTSVENGLGSPDSQGFPLCWNRIAPIDSPLSEVGLRPGQRGRTLSYRFWRNSGIDDASVGAMWIPIGTLLMQLDVKA